MYIRSLLTLLALGTYFTSSVSVAAPLVDISALAERLRSTVSTETPVESYYSFYVPFVIDADTITSSLRTIDFLPPHQKRAFRLQITGDDPVVFAKPQALLAIGGLLIPAPEHTPEEFSIIEGTKISLIPYRIKESIPAPILTATSTPASDVTISYNTEDTARPYSFLGTYQEGQDIHMTQLLARIAERINTKEQQAITVPMLRTLPRIHTENFPEDAVHVREVVATGVSDFRGSSVDRVHNIETALAIYNGIVIRSGEEFSFNTLLGPVDETTGYRKELVIKGPETIPEFGGGVCQVSSTIYRAALAAGMEIVERRNHSYAVSYYEPWGSDATIYPGVVDFRFRNDTAYDLIVHAYTKDQQVFFQFYGIKDGRRVTLDGPYTYGHQAPPAFIPHAVSWLAPGARQLRQNGVEGFQAHWVRTTTMPDGTEHKQTFRSNYQARPAHYYVGPEAAPQEEPTTE